MNYRHDYHAGNVADVFKHLVLIRLLAAMRRKDKPFCYLDTHAGSAAYSLAGEAARRTGEWQEGIGRLWNVDAGDGPLADLLATVAALPDNQGSSIPAAYPGSGTIAGAWLRPDDRAVLCEWLPDVARALKADFAGDRRVAVHHRNGYEGLSAFLPPAERRGVVLIDPPFEDRDEFERLRRAVVMAHRRWDTGVIAAWYPLKDRRQADRFLAGLASAGIRRRLIVEFAPLPADVPGRLFGSGLAIVNPPWQVDEELRAALPALMTHLTDDPARASWRVEPHGD